jgi:voltage-gated potassium channel
MPTVSRSVVTTTTGGVGNRCEHLGRGWHRTCDIVSYVIWAAFAVDYVIRVRIANHRGRYVLRHVLDVVIIALPVLRPLRLLRLVMLLKVLNKGATESLRGRIAVYVTGSTVLLVFCAALAVLDAERHRPAANITTFGDALWWAVSTITTVGYGDRYPITTEGRFIAVGLMIGGIALLGVVTASIASWLIDRVRAGAGSAPRPRGHARDRARRPGGIHRRVGAPLSR